MAAARLQQSCDDPACENAFDWASSPWEFVASTKTDPIGFAIAADNPPTAEPGDRFWKLAATNRTKSHASVVTIESAKFDDGSIWRPNVWWQCKDPKQVPCTGPQHI